MVVFIKFKTKNVLANRMLNDENNQQPFFPVTLHFIFKLLNMDGSHFLGFS